MSEPKTRLHITPFTPDILPSVIPPSIRPSATEISFHTIPTFPENSYGYVTLPTMEAEKIRKKLNGSILKGKKFKIEAARPQKRHRSEDEPETSTNGKESKKRKSEDGVLDGYEMPSDRIVKRGWTEPGNVRKERRRSEKTSKVDKKEKPQPKSKYTEKPECLFRTKIPLNRASDGSIDDKKVKKKKKKSSESVVHEFANTFTHPSFLRAKGESVPQTAAFEDGKGWLDTEGHLKESAAQRTRKADHRPGQVAGAKEKRSVRNVSQQNVQSESAESTSESEDWTSSSGSSEDESSGSESETSHSSSDEMSSSSAEEQSSGVQTPPKATVEHVNTGENTADNLESVEASESEQESNRGSAKEVHPLEALFKRAAPATSQNQSTPEPGAGFSFFGNNEDTESSEDEPQPADPQTPFTPFTTKDLQNRGLRSAAPTPDTSMVTRHLKWTGSDEVDNDDEFPIDTPVSKALKEEAPAGRAETEFAKWFWENRGENNRAWKKRRRDAAKEQRQRENRRKGIKGKS